LREDRRKIASAPCVRDHHDSVESDSRGQSKKNLG
jgi:hypothetical protein